ncbi:MAG: hypothetical protein MZV49_13655 [Rhodopseudomonas palustris]|nr:hypothetical protein [Rhodopseudomonas palustris]
MAKSTFDVIILIGRPAAGKSEVIDYLKKVPLPERIERFHIGEFQEIDDFPILWERFEDDDLMEEMGQPRLLTDKEFTYEGKTMPGHVFKGKWFWNFLIKKLNLAVCQDAAQRPRLPRAARPCSSSSPAASEHGGFREAFSYLSPQVLDHAAALYIKRRLARVAAQEPPALQPRPSRLHPAARPGGQEDRDALQGIGLGRVRR